MKSPHPVWSVLTLAACQWSSTETVELVEPGSATTLGAERAALSSDGSLEQVTRANSEGEAAPAVRELTVPPTVAPVGGACGSVGHGTVVECQPGSFCFAASATATPVCVAAARARSFEG
jgi:hypothetical protein